MSVASTKSPRMPAGANQSWSMTARIKTRMAERCFMKSFYPLFYDLHGLDRAMSYGNESDASSKRLFGASDDVLHRPHGNRIRHARRRAINDISRRNDRRFRDGFRHRIGTADQKRVVSFRADPHRQFEIRIEDGLHHGTMRRNLRTKPIKISFEENRVPDSDAVRGAGIDRHVRF